MTGTEPREWGLPARSASSRDQGAIREAHPDAGSVLVRRMINEDDDFFLLIRTPTARRPFGRQRTLPARSVAGSDRRHPRSPRQDRRRLRGDKGEHPRRGQARYPDQSHDHPLRVVRRGRARPDLPAHPRGPRAESSGARKARWASHGSTARRTTSGASSSWAFPKPPSSSSPAHRRLPYDPLQLHECPGAQAEPLACISTCAVRRRQSSAGANPARQLSLQPVAIGADGGGNNIV